MQRSLSGKVFPEEIHRPDHHSEKTEKTSGRQGRSRDMQHSEIGAGGERTQAEGRQGTIRLPISVELLEKLRAAWETEGSRDTAMLWIACSLCFLGFVRSGELTLPEGHTFDLNKHLCFAALAVDKRENPQMVQVTLKTSKTDLFRKRVKVYMGKMGT